MTIIQLYELKYIDRDTFLEHLWGSGQQLIEKEGVCRLKFYIESAAGYHSNTYYIIPFKK